ncbi:hypothetical protein KAT92_03815 [Candidatus Babeliales bacterium]|nr:hypothetical protein [Candidatus Babeliales bacterium]
MRKILFLLVAILIPLNYTFGNNPDIESIENLLSFAQQEKESLEIEWLACEENLTEKLKLVAGNELASMKLISQARTTQEKIEDEIEKIEKLLEELKVKREAFPSPQLLRPRERVQGKVQPVQANASRPSRVSQKRKPRQQHMQSHRVQQKQEIRVAKKNRFQAKPAPTAPTLPRIYRGFTTISHRAHKPSS